MKTKNGIQQFMQVVFILGGSVIGIAILAIVLGAFAGTQTANSLPANITNAGLTLIDNATRQFGTIGTITGVLLLASVVAAFGFGGYWMYNRLNQ